MYDDFLCDVWKSGWLDDKNAYIVVNFATYFNLDIDQVKKIKPFDCFGNSTLVFSNILFMINALDEFPHMRRFCPQCQILFHPNNCFLVGFRLRSKDTPNVINTTEPLCIIISKGHKVKRNELSLPIPNKFFITYDVQNDVEPFENFNPVKTYKDLHTSVVKQLLTQADFGAVFSAVEGNCYASNEYLLSGLPVLSTYSKGGRDYFYDANNSVQCEGTLEGIKEGYLRMKEFILHSPNFDRYQIKKRVEEKVDVLRKSLVDKVSYCKFHMNTIFYLYHYFMIYYLLVAYSYFTFNSMTNIIYNIHI